MVRIAVFISCRLGHNVCTFFMTVTVFMVTVIAVGINNFYKRKERINMIDDFVKVIVKILADYDDNELIEELERRGYEIKHKN